MPPAPSVGGWVIILLGIHEESTEDDVLEKVERFGKVENIHLNLDRRTGYAKGYALVEFSAREEAAAAVAGLRGAKILGKEIEADWAFLEKPKKIK